MIERYAICFDNLCENICMWDGVVWSPENPTAWQPPAGALMVNVESIPCDIGWVWDGSQFNAPVVIEASQIDSEPEPV